MTKMKIVVAGNATLDAFILGTTQISEDGSSVIISSDGKTVEFKVEDPPVRKGHKHRVGQALEGRIEDLWHKIEPGGGGYHSVVAMRNSYDEKALVLTYMDVSTPAKSVTQELNVRSIQYHFFCERPIPLNIILNGREDKITLKGPQLGRFSPSSTEIEEAKLHIAGSNAVLINSVKDPGYVERYIEIARKRNIPLYFVVSTSLEPDFVQKKVLPAGVSILNYDDLADFYGLRGAINEKDKMSHALEVINRIRKDKINTHKNIYVTLGKNGVFCSVEDSITHVRLSDEYLELVQNAILESPKNTNGAGDVFAANVVLYEISGQEKSPVQIAINASQAAIRHIGYNLPLPPNAFTVAQVPYTSTAPLPGLR